MSSLHTLSTTRRSNPSRRVRAGVATAAVVLAVAPFAAACGAGFNAATDSIKPNAGAATVGPLRINNVWVVVDPSSGDAEVIGAVANTGGDQASLPQVSVDGTSATIAPPPVDDGSSTAGPLTGIAAGQSISFGEQGQPEIVLTGSSLSPGNLATVKFDFGSAGTGTITAQVESNTGLFADYNPNSNALVPGTSASPSASATGLGASPSSSASVNPLSSAGTSISPTPTTSAPASPSTTPSTS